MSWMPQWFSSTGGGNVEDPPISDVQLPSEPVVVENTHTVSYDL